MSLCNDCKFFCRYPVPRWASPRPVWRRGECRRHAPTIVTDAPQSPLHQAKGDTVGAWPQVVDDWFCGEFESTGAA